MPRNGPVLIPPRRANHFVVRRRFQGIVGKRRSAEILPVLTEAHAAYMGLKLHSPSIRGRGANIYTQWVGDPDALGSALLLRAVLRALGAKDARILTGSLGHPQNYKLVELAGLTLHSPNAGRMRGGRHIKYDKPTPLANLHLTLLDKVGVHLDSFQDSEGHVEELFEPLSV